MRNYTKHRKNRRGKRTRRLSGGMFGMFKRKPAAAAAASGEPDVGDIDSHEKGVADKLKAADAALVAAQQAQQSKATPKLDALWAAHKAKYADVAPGSNKALAGPFGEPVMWCCIRVTMRKKAADRRRCAFA